MDMDDVLAKLKSLEATGACPACGNERWEPQAGIVAHPTVAGDTINLAEGIPCAVLLCTHCGNARFHSTQLLEGR
jgi:hypothetical protein